MGIDYNRIDRLFRSKSLTTIHMEKEFAEILKLLKAGDIVADIGCGSSEHFEQILKFIGREGKIIGIDVGREGLKLGRSKFKDENVSFVRADGVKLPLKAGFADVTISTNILGYFANFPGESEVPFIKELSRITKKGGYVVLDFMNKDFSQIYNNVLSIVNPIEYAENKKQLIEGDNYNTERFGSANYLVRTHSKHWIKKLMLDSGLEIIRQENRYQNISEFPNEADSRLKSDFRKTPSNILFIAKKL